MNAAETNVAILVKSVVTVNVGLRNLVVMVKFAKPNAAMRRTMTVTG